MNGEYENLPVHEQSWKKLLSAVPKRVVGLISKAIGLKMLVFGLATYLLIRGTVTEYVWMAVALVLIFGKQALQFVKDIKK